MTLKVPDFSFVRFFDADHIEATCSDVNAEFYLPVLEYDDWAFQVLAQFPTKALADTFVTNIASVDFALVNRSNTLLINYNNLTPSYVRVSDLIVAVGWQHGFPNFATYVQTGGCFKVRMIIGGQTYYSNIFQRIKEDCYTSVIEYSGSEIQHGFVYSTPEIPIPDGGGTGGFDYDLDFDID